LDAVQSAAQQGAWCVGYLRYEAASAFDAALAVYLADGPLAWFAVFDEALPWSQEAAVDALAVQWQGGLARSAFDLTVEQIRQAIAAGTYYQVNFTATMQGLLADYPIDVQAAASTSLQAAVPATGVALFQALQRAQPGGYAAYLDTGAEQILSVSPELFFDWRNGHILTRPMKGTAPRGTTPQEDAARAQALRASDKERAENVMVVDLLRNDLSRIAQPHSVTVPRLFHTEALPSVWQMTSDVVARTRAGCTLADVFAALFPCGSVTGAPKVQAMQAIRALEAGPRGVYCGAIGVVQPGGDATFNVPIRTLTLQGSVVRCGIGSGITAGSVAQDEWSEWQHKAAFVRRATSPMELLETLRLQSGQWHLLDGHMARMAQAAQHFGYPWDASSVHTVLNAVQALHASGAWRVRLLLNAQGKASAQAYALAPSPQRVRIQLADRPIDEAQSEFVRFKTTHRAHYDVFAPLDADVFDTLLWNPQQEITECIRGNIALQWRGQWVTPPVRCGLLAGVGRAQALADGRLREAVVRVSDLDDVTAIAFINSLRGWIDGDLYRPGA
jgi:para-aminobenzoate synthetase/4-amino-4-deoxychorismate lyase